MILTDPAAFLAAFDEERFPPRGPSTARAAFTVAPADFSLAAESARDNRYMDLSAAPDPLRALAEHAGLTRRIGADLPTLCFPGDPACPDGIFPNNVFATAPGRLIVGRMRHAVRRREAGRADIRAFFTGLLGYRTIDLSQESFVAELTGALVIDRARGIGYCGLSERCDRAGARAMQAAFGLRLMFCFDLAPGEYHTNVVLALLAGRSAIIAPDGFADPAVPDAIARAYGGRAVFIDAAQKRAYAGNAISLTPQRVWMSERAADALTPGQRAALAGWGWSIGSVDLATIETAGGSLRCCVAEIY